MAGVYTADRLESDEADEDFAALMDQIRTAENNGDVEVALYYCLEAVAAAPEHINLRCHAAWLLGESGQHAEAEKLIREGLARQPESVSLGRSLAETLSAQGRYLEAIEAARHLIWPLRKDTAFRVAFAEWLVRAGEAGISGDPAAAKHLADLWDELHENEKNIEDEWLRELENNRQPNAQPLPPDAPYVSSLFDCYAEGFDEHLEALGYCAPQVLRTAVDRSLSERNGLEILDLGCGTGLAGVAFKPLARKLIGVDFSSRMIMRAKRRGIYDQLIQDEMMSALKKLSSSSADLIVAADVLIYTGELKELFIQIARVLRPGGGFAATVEKPLGGRAEYALQPSRRYAHNEQYIRRLAAASLFDVLAMESFVMRREKPRPIDALAFVLKKKA